MSLNTAVRHAPIMPDAVRAVSREDLQAALGTE